MTADPKPEILSAGTIIPGVGDNSPGRIVRNRLKFRCELHGDKARSRGNRNIPSSSPLAIATAAKKQCYTSIEAALDSLIMRKLVAPVSQETRSQWRLTPDIRRMQPHNPGKSTREHLLNLLRLHSDQGMVMAEIIDELAISRSMAKRLLEVLHAEGLASIQGKGRASRWFPRRE